MRQGGIKTRPRRDTAGRQTASPAPLYAAPATLLGYRQAAGGCTAVLFRPAAMRIPD
jgi:hypothetical protein